LKLERAIEYMEATPSRDFDITLFGSEISGFQTDSRKAGPADLFFAFSQPEFKQNGFNGDFLDATAFVESAFQNGAAACVVRRDRATEHGLEKFSGRLIYAEDVIRAFQKLANRVAADWAGPVVAITGSAGKTTAKELTAHLLESVGKRVLKNEKNLNNGIGHPSTVLKLAADASYDIAVLEMGMSSPLNEIARLCRITPPDVAVELNVLPVHIEHLGSIENVAKAKAELLEGLKPGGTAILNADDPRVVQMKDLCAGPVLTFGVEQAADISAEEITMKRFGETHFVLKTPDGDANVVFQLSGHHNILNALAASAVGYSFGMTAAEISESLESVKPPHQRGEILRFAEGFTVINDSYNSNPDALLRMVRLLQEGAGENERKIIVAGEMLELGAEEKEIHRRTGGEIAAIGADVLIGVRGNAAELVQGAAEGGIKTTRFFEDAGKAGEYLADVVGTGDLILVKGSRGVRTERTIEALKKRFEAVQTTGAV
ncbi:MAG: UDP-N-acetylmuramoyl-tripeptide--D-alanyl-D-alanine ligase, partial [Acidobacteriota bacterium]|nr:UDP-N-acetylmuramoyl-tripeptide--D-alanyl-D-alanine ligase [Acidobacteriota bacterium]